MGSSDSSVSRKLDWRWCLRVLGLVLIIVGMPGTLKTLGIWEPSTAYFVGGTLGIVWMLIAR